MSFLRPSNLEINLFGHDVDSDVKSKGTISSIVTEDERRFYHQIGTRFHIIHNEEFLFSIIMANSFIEYRLPYRRETLFLKDTIHKTLLYKRNSFNTSNEKYVGNRTRGGKLFHYKNFRQQTAQ